MPQSQGQQRQANVSRTAWEPRLRHFGEQLIYLGWVVLDARFSRNRDVTVRARVGVGHANLPVGCNGADNFAIALYSEVQFGTLVERLVLHRQRVRVQRAVCVAQRRCSIKVAR